MEVNQLRDMCEVLMRIYNRSKYIKCKDGTWLNRDYIHKYRVYGSGEVWQILVETETRYNIVINSYSSESEAQRALDDLMEGQDSVLERLEREFREVKRDVIDKLIAEGVI